MYIQLQNSKHRQKLASFTGFLAIVVFLSLFFPNLVVIISINALSENIHTNSSKYSSEAEESDLSYFQDAVMFGDSLAQSFDLHNALPKLRVFSKVGNSASALLRRRSFTYKEKKSNMIEILGDLKPKKIYIWIGLNGIDKNTTDTIITDYEALIDSIQTTAPDSILYCLSVTPINEKKLCNKYPHLSNSKIIKFNLMLHNLCLKKKSHFLDIFSILANEKNNLIRKFDSDDGYHLNKEGYFKVAQHLQTHIVPQENKKEKNK